MNHRFLLVILLGMYSCTLNSANNAIEIKPTDVCSYYGETLPSTIYAFMPDYTAEAIIDKITTYSGLRRNFTIRASDIPNAAAVMQHGERFLLYNQEFMESVKQKTHTYWASISIMAHEVGHHLQGHTLSGESSRPTTEIEADEYSGFILQKMGATLEEAQAAMNALAPEMGSDTHPPRRTRLLAIRAGWIKAAELGGLPIKSTSTALSPPTLAPPPSIATTFPSSSSTLSQPTSLQLTARPVSSASSFQISSDGLSRYNIQNSLVKDTTTGLIWTRCSIGQKWDGYTCQGVATKYQWDQIVFKHFDFAGYNDWRVPTVTELKTLLYCSSGQPSYWNDAARSCEGNYTKPTLVSKAFPNVATDAVFWTSTVKEYDASSVWVVDFADGIGHYETKNRFFAMRLVRN